MIFITVFIFYWVKNAVAESAKSISFWQITDIHYDKFYVQNGKKDEFCHGTDGTAEMFGEYGCETGTDIFVSSTKAMAEIESDPEFILWTGDSSPHWSKSPPNWTYIFEAYIPTRVVKNPKM